MSVRLHLIVEGQTEKRFVDDLLAPHLVDRQVYADARCVLTSRDGAHWHRGGLFDYVKPKKDICMWMKQERKQSDVFFSTMFDLYALPAEFPGYNEAQKCSDPYEKVGRLEGALGTDIGSPRFIPYLQLHEFEALILADPQKLDWEFIGHEEAIENLVSMCHGQEAERINEGAATAPSKRITAEIPEFGARKAFAGPSVVKQIGLSTLRRTCPHFGHWLTELEDLASRNVT